MYHKNDVITSIKAGVFGVWVLWIKQMSRTVIPGERKSEITLEKQKLLDVNLGRD